MSRDAFDVACAYLALRERTGFEIKNYLKKKDFTAEETDEAIVKLQEFGYINDKDYAVRYIEYAMSKGWGIGRIRQELRVRGVNADDIDDAVYETEKTKAIDFSDQKERAWETALDSVKGKIIDDKTIAKVGRRLKTLGYGSSEVYYAVGKLMNLANKEKG